MLPEQLPLKQVSSCLSGPSQFDWSEVRHCLSLLLTPSPHILEHELHCKSIGLIYKFPTCLRGNLPVPSDSSQVWCSCFPILVLCSIRPWSWRCWWASQTPMEMFLLVAFPGLPNYNSFQGNLTTTIEILKCILMLLRVFYWKCAW